MKNKWKTGFFLLLGFIVLIVIILLSLIMIPSNENGKVQQTIPNNKNVSFEVKSNKADLNVLINQYIKKEAADSPIEYSIQLQDEVELYGTLQFFSQEVDLKLTFEPEALENGDLILRQKQISIGHLQLPVPVVLKFIRDSYDIPSWITIRPNDEEMYVNLHDLKLKSDTKVRVNTFDLKRDNIAFTLLVPIK